jgi:hypothetical protein
MEPGRAWSNLDRFAQISEHDKRIDETAVRVPERARQPPYDGEAQRLPQPRGPFVGRNREVELHAANRALLGVSEPIDAQDASNSDVVTSVKRNVSAIVSIGAGVSVIHENMIGSDNADVGFFVDISQSLPTP